MDVDIVGLARAVISLLGLGLVMGFTPTLYAFVLHLLTRDQRAAVMIRWLSLGIGLGATVLLLIFRVIDPQTITAILRGRVEAILIHRSIDIAAGSIFVLLAVVEFIRCREPRKPPRMPKKEHPDQPATLILIGFANTAIGLSGMATMYITGRVITSASHSVLIEFPLYLVFLLTLLGPYLLMAWAWAAFPQAADKITALSTYLARLDHRPMVATGLLIAGIVFLSMGIRAH